jgi:ABC-type microcin C transport system duplicated ATPase subunit YejF
LKNVFALRGKSKMGKSQTIRTVVEMLTEKHPDTAVEHNHTTKVDVRVVLTINGLKIGIESQSGPSGIKESLDLFVKIGCDVIVCATRTSGATVNAVNALQGFDVHWLQQQSKSQPHEQVLRSLIQAREIVEEIEAFIAAPEPVKALARSASA